jgi:competence protein CoiA
MNLAIMDGRRVEARPGNCGHCPQCQGEVIAKCGDIKVWHWAHMARDCDPWSEPETAWHLGWKARYPEACREVVMGPHRADVRLPDGTVIEFQHSSISEDEIREREAFYGRMIWVIDGSPFVRNFQLRPKAGYHTFRWRWPRPTLSSASQPVVLDLPKTRSWCGMVAANRESVSGWNSIEGDGEHGFSMYRNQPACLFLLRKYDPDPPSGGWGLSITLDGLLEGRLRPVK